MRRFDILLVAVAVLVVLALEGAALVAGWFGGWTGSVPVAVALAALLIYLGLRQRTILILLTGLIMFTQSFLYWYGDYGRPLHYLLGTLAGSLVVIGGTLRDLFRSRHQVSGRLLALAAAIVSAALSFLAWNVVKVITEHLRPELLVLIAASLIATVALAADLAHTPPAPAEGSPPRRRMPTLQRLLTVVVLVVTAFGGVVIWSESRSDLAKAEARLDCENTVISSVGDPIAAWEGAYPATLEDAIRALMDLDLLSPAFTTLQPLGTRYGEGAYQAFLDGKAVAIAWVVPVPGAPGSFVCKEAVYCARW